MLKSIFNKETSTQVFSCEIFEKFRNTYSEEHLQTTASKFAILVRPLEHDKERIDRKREKEIERE